MVKKILPLLVFGLLCALALELSYRAYALGPQALNPLWLNSMRTLLESGLVQPSADLETWYELRPDIDALHGGVPLTTNSAGLADREYPTAKPADVIRVAVLGSSWTMPTGVKHQQAWHAQLEARLNARGGKVRYEFINFGVELYGLGEIAGTLRTRVMDYDPDLIMIGLTTLSTYFVREQNTVPFAVPPVRYPALESFALRTLDSQLGLGLYDRDQKRADLGADVPRHRAQTEAFLREVHAFGTANKTPVAIVWLGFRPLRSKYEQMVLNTTAELNMPLVIGYRGIVRDIEGDWGTDFADPRYRISRFDSHPNVAGHARIADEVEQALFPSR